MRSCCFNLTDLHVYIYIHVCVFLHLCIYIYVYIYKYININIYLCTQQVADAQRSDADMRSWRFNVGNGRSIRALPHANTCNFVEIEEDETQEIAYGMMNDVAYGMMNESLRVSESGAAVQRRVTSVYFTSDELSHWLSASVCIDEVSVCVE